MSVNKTSDNINIKQPDNLVQLIKSESIKLLPEFENLLTTLSTPGHEPNTLKEATQDFTLLTKRLFEAVQMAEISVILPMFSHIFDNLTFFMQHGTALTLVQKQTITNWLNVFIMFLDRPDDTSIINDVVSAQTDTNWFIPMSDDTAQRFFQELSSYFIKRANIDNYNSKNNLIDFPLKTSKKVNLPIDTDDEQLKQSIQNAYKTLTINRNNAWLNIAIETLNILIPQTDIVTIETIAGLDHKQASPPEVAHLTFNNNTIPIYALNDSYKVLDQIPSTYTIAIILKSKNGHYGLLCEKMSTHTTHEAIEIEKIPAVILSSSSPIYLMTSCKNKITYIVRSDDLKTYIERFTT